MSSKLLWTGLAIIIALPKFLPGMTWEIVGAIFMLIGAILLWLDK